MCDVAPLMREGVRDREKEREAGRKSERVRDEDKQD